MYLVRIFFYICDMKDTFTFRQWLLIIKRRRIKKVLSMFKSKEMIDLSDLSSQYLTYRINKL